MGHPCQFMNASPLFFCMCNSEGGRGNAKNGLFLKEKSTPTSGGWPVGAFLRDHTQNQTMPSNLGELLSQ